MHQQVQGRAQGLQSAGQRLDALDPQRVLRRGYAWVTDAEGRPVLSAHAVARGDRLNTVWADGAARVEVMDVKPSPAGESQR